MVQTIYCQKVVEKNSTHLGFKGLMDVLKINKILQQPLHSENVISTEKQKCLIRSDTFVSALSFQSVFYILFMSAPVSMASTLSLTRANKTFS